MDAVIAQQQSALNSTIEYPKTPAFNRRKLLFLIPIILGLGMLFVSSIGGVGLFAHSSPQWLQNIVNTVGQPGNWTFLTMMIGGGVLGLAGVIGGIYGLAKNTNPIEEYFGDYFDEIEDNKNDYINLESGYYLSMQYEEGDVFFVIRTHAPDNKLLCTQFLSNTQEQQLEQALKSLNYQLSDDYVPPTDTMPPNGDTQLSWDKPD